MTSRYNQYLTSRRNNYMRSSKLKRQNAFMVNRFRPSRTVNSGSGTRSFVPRSYGTPMAVTERKYFDTQLTGAALVDCSSSWSGAEVDPTTLNTLFCPSTGSDFNNRDGRKVHVTSIRIRGRIVCTNQADQTAADPSTMCRVILVMDKQTNATQLSAEDVISSGSGSEMTDGFQNPANFGRFRVLRDKRMILQNPAISYDGTNIEQNGISRLFQFTVNFRRPMAIHFNSTNGGTVADIIDNSFHLIAGCTHQGLAPSIQYKCRVTFIDA